ncbi:subunit 2 of anaphase-promoting complex [Chloropicon roscoffensis]|uniref:Anaphase-promoting complex subunit 2 n=3 Tax=Chloropicon roscoffensis TaxID=1461544 RepID=A0AAX4PKP4_9CHLO
MEVDSSREGSLFSVEYGHGSQNQEVETAHSHGRGPAGPAVVSRCLEETYRALADFERGLRDQVCDDGEGGIWGSPWAAAESDAEGLVSALRRVEGVRSNLTARLKSSASAGLLRSSLSPNMLEFWLKKIEREARSVVFSVVVVSAPKSLKESVSCFYREAFSSYIEATEATACGDEVDDDEEDEMGTAPRRSIEEVMGSEWCRRLSFVGQTLHKLGLSSRSEKAYADAIFEHLEAWIQDRAAGEYTGGCLRAAQRHTEGVVMAFLRPLLESTSGDKGSEAQRSALAAQWKSRLDYFIYEILGRLRTEEMFDIVVDFPDSVPALRDLKTCLEHTNQTDAFIAHFSSQLRRRLLHLGAATPVILAQYVSSIKALNLLDPTGILAEVICPLVKDYVKRRPDTTRCVVNMVVYDENLLSAKPGGEEEGEDGGEVAAPFSEASTEEMEDEEVVQRELRWEPVPIQAAQLFDAASGVNVFKRASRDIVAALIDVLGNKDYFIKEYKMILAERLLSKVDDDIDDETRILELLKLRFGANSLRDCEVMLKDMADSKRIVANIRNLARPRGGLGAAGLDRDFSAVILSELFWPPLFEGACTTPEAVDSALQAFGSQYKALKAPRTLHWKPHLGVVDLELCFGDDEEAKEFTVSVAQAMVISQFEQRLTWRANDLAAAAGIAADQIAEKAAIWVNSGILRKRTDKVTREVTYELVEDPAEQQERPNACTRPDLAVMSQEQLMEANMKVYESYVMGMVTNLESLPLQKIHNMLKMFVLEPVYDKTIEELEAFLAKLVNDGKLTFDGNVYRKKKN